MNRKADSGEKRLVETVDDNPADQHKQPAREVSAQKNIYDGIFIGINSVWNIDAKIYATIKVENNIVNAEIRREDRDFLQRYVPIGSKLTVSVHKNKWSLVNLKKSTSEYHKNIVINTLE